MKKNLYRSLAILFSFTISLLSIFNCFNVKSQCGVITDAYTYVRDNFADTVSAIGGAVWDTTSAIANWGWNEFKLGLGIETDEDMEDYEVNERLHETILMAVEDQICSLEYVEETLYRLLTNHPEEET